MNTMSTIETIYVSNKVDTLTNNLEDVQSLISAAQKKLVTLENNSVNQSEFAELQHLVLTTTRLQHQINKDFIDIYKTYRKVCEIQYDKMFNEFSQAELKNIKRIRKVAWALGAVAVVATVALIIACVSGIL